MLRGKLTHAAAGLAALWVLLYALRSKLGLDIDRDTFDIVLSLIGCGAISALRRGIKKDYDAAG